MKQTSKHPGATVGQFIFIPSYRYAFFGSVSFGLGIPIRMKLYLRCVTSVAWNDFDRFVETITGKETLYDTVDITYQTITEEESVD